MPSKKKVEEPIETKPKIRIKIKAYDHKIVDTSSKRIVETVTRYGAQVKGPIPLPTEIKRFTVVRPTFVHKDSQEQFEIRIHKRLIEILSITPKVIDALKKLELPIGVDIEIKT